MKMVEKYVLLSTLSPFLKKNYTHDLKFEKIRKWDCHRSFVVDGS